MSETKAWRVEHRRRLVSARGKRPKIYDGSVHLLGPDFALDITSIPSLWHEDSGLVYAINALEERVRAAESPSSESSELYEKCAALGHPFQRCHCGASGVAGT